MPVVTLPASTVEVRTPVGQPPLRRFRALVPLALPTGPAGDPLRFDVATTRLRARVQPYTYDALAPGALQADVTTAGGGAIVALGAPRRVLAVELTAAAADVERLDLHRVDGAVLAVEPTVTATRHHPPPRTYRVSGTFVADRLGLRARAGAATTSPALSAGALRRVEVRSDPAGVRLSVATADHEAAAVPVWQATDPSVTTVDVTGALVDALGAVLPPAVVPAPPTVPVVLILSADTPVRIVIDEMTVGYRSVDRGFAPLPLGRADVADVDAFTAGLRVPRDAVAAHLRSLLTPAVREALHRAVTATPALVDRLLDDLTVALETEGLYDAARFAAIPLSDDLRTLAAAGPTGERRVRVNRLLLEAALPDVLRPRTVARTVDLRERPAVAVRRPPGAVVEEAWLPTIESLPATRPASTDDVTVPDGALGVEVTAERWTAARVAPPVATRASGVELRVTAVSARTQLRCELREDHGGLPDGRVLATGEVTLPPPGTTGWARVRFEEAVVVPGNDHWVTALATVGRAIWRSAVGAPAAWSQRGHDAVGWTAVDTGGRTARVGLLTERPSSAARPAVTLTADGVVPAAARVDDRVTYDLAGVLSTAPGAGPATVSLRVEATDGSLRLEAPTLVYDLPGS